MTKKRCSRVKKIQSLPSDMISNLPENLIETILTHLPTRDAVRTSILSRKWRYRWTNLPKLVFDNTLLCQEPRGNQLSPTKEILFTIYKIILLHNRPILEFSLTISELEPCSEVDLLVLFLSRNGVEKLTLYFWKDEYKLPLSLFSCLRLTHLDLAYCLFKPPPTFNGFSCLTSLEFDEVSFDAKTFGSFISSCPLLERLYMQGCTSFCFEVIAPKLNYLYFQGSLDSFYFKNVPLLAIVSIYPLAEVKLFNEGETSGLRKFFGSLPVLENLEMDYNFVKSLVAGGSVPEKLPTTLVRLRNLELLDICFGTLDEVLFVLCLIRSSPNLERFVIQMFPSTVDLGVEDVISEDFSDLILDKLRKVAIKAVSGTLVELKFIKLVLAKSPILETLVVEPTLKDATDRLKILEKLVRFQRASPKAELICENQPPSV
ncbi:hypothetical protein LguiB_025046 [Lonicera macranthoides]